ncbi:ATP-grasp fold amidoligase family protein [Ruegeria sp. HKCCA5491]|uniref:ATP-grasp fold amidoligase family protein n=1 Tax=Ruegeria sp. HKCCA5491 TaxID=2682986 RepID=UPI00148765DA|nr:ATP-grasp fold amidoligase family protein [Ruegeria sp. HKCCA5491]
MRPFVEQHFYNRRSRKQIGDRYLSYLPEYLEDFKAWYDENLDSTLDSVSKQKFRIASTSLNRARWARHIRRGIAGYLRKRGEYPDFLSAKDFGAMNILHSLLMPMPLTNPADKLSVGKHIPSSLVQKVGTAPVLREWAPDEKLNFDGIEPGRYFLKANHGSAMNLRLELPCDDSTKAEAQALVDKWMATDHGKYSSQWWYHLIDRRAFIERDLNDGGIEPLTDFRFHVINGEPVLLQMDVGLGTNERHNPVYDSDLNYLPYNFLRRNLHEVPLPEGADTAKELARAIGSKYQYCRVDLYITGNQYYLGELTFLPNAGRRIVQSPELNEYLCGAWNPMPRFVKLS